MSRSALVIPAGNAVPDDVERSSAGRGGTVVVESFIDSQPVSRTQWATVLLCFLVVLADGFDTAAIGYIAPSLTELWQISKADLAPVLSASLVGVAIGALLAGPLGDRAGRKSVVIGAAVFFGVTTLATAFVNTLTALAVLRFITGIGLGAAIPNCVTLVAEYAPQRYRSLLVNATYCGFPVGAAVGGFASIWLIPNFGWHSVLVVGGVVPLILAVLVAALVPESVRYLVSRGAPVQRVKAILNRLGDLGTGPVERFVLAEAAAPKSNSALSTILSSNYLVGTIMLWIVYFMGLVVFYLLTSWMPLLMSDAGFTPANAALLTAIFIYLVGQQMGDIGLLAVLIFIAGTAMNGAQSSMPAIAAAFYPTDARATGVAFMYGVGRMGGIAGVFLGGVFTSMKLGLPAVFTLLAVPSLIAALALLVKWRVHRHTVL